MKEELKKRAFVPAWLLGTIHDPTFDAGPSSDKSDKAPPASERLRLVVPQEKKLRAA